MITIGITGISGSGKTAASAMLAEMGGFVVEADPLAHALMKKNGAAYDEIIKAFGTEILDEEKEIHRPALGALVFDDGDKLRQLEGIIHPKVIEETAELISGATKTGKYKFAVIDAPLLIEAGMHRNCNSTWLITANHEIRLARIITRDNISKEAAEKRLASRKGDEALIPHADVIIENNGSLPELERNITQALKTINVILH